MKHFSSNSAAELQTLPRSHDARAHLPDGPGYEARSLECPECGHVVIERAAIASGLDRKSDNEQTCGGHEI
jgi:hypothetical protein